MQIKKFGRFGIDIVYSNIYRMGLSKDYVSPDLWFSVMGTEPKTDSWGHLRASFNDALRFCRKLDCELPSIIDINNFKNFILFPSYLTSFIDFEWESEDVNSSCAEDKNVEVAFRIKCTNLEDLI